MNNLVTTSTYAAISAVLEALYDTEDIELLSDEDGEAAVLAALSSNGDLVAVLTSANILGQVITYLWQIIKRVQAKIKALIEMLVDKIRDLTGQEVEWYVAPGGGVGD